MSSAMSSDEIKSATAHEVNNTLIQWSTFPKGLTMKSINY